MANPPQNMNRSLKILSHNIRGINSDTKWNSLRNNIMETNCDILCIQETKRSPSTIRIFVIFATDLYISSLLVLLLEHLEVLLQYGKELILMLR
jgi:hypothetical protein